jgi:hypothetical protein
MSQLSEGVALAHRVVDESNRTGDLAALEAYAAEEQAASDTGD